jgi:hypothetical protein
VDRGVDSLAGTVAPFGRGENADPASDRLSTGRVSFVPTDTVYWHSQAESAKDHHNTKTNYKSETA